MPRSTHARVGKESKVVVAQSRVHGVSRFGVRLPPGTFNVLHPHLRCNQVWYDIAYPSPKERALANHARKTNNGMKGWLRDVKAAAALRPIERNWQLGEQTSHLSNLLLHGFLIRCTHLIGLQCMAFYSHKKALELC
jgi:hypothetical protein